MIAAACLLAATWSPAARADTDTTRWPPDPWPTELLSSDVDTTRSAPTTQSAVEPRPGRQTVSPTTCDQEKIVDTRGDGRPFDIVSHELTSDCSTWTFTTRLAKPLDVSRLNLWELDFDIDGRPTGCRGVDRIMFAFVDNGRLTAYMLDLPQCDSSTWSTIAVVPVQRPDTRTLRVSFDSSAIAHASRFRWWAAIDALGDGGFDAAPNAGFVQGFTPLPAPTQLAPTVVESKVRFAWKAPVGALRSQVSYEFTMQRLDDRSVAPTVRRTRERVVRLGALPTGEYAISVRAINGDKVGPPARITITWPMAGGGPL